MPRKLIRLENHFMKKITLAVLPLVALGLSTTVFAATSDGKTFGVSAGWLHVMPQSDAQGVNGKTGKVLGEKVVTSPEAGFDVQDADTAGLMLDYFVNDHVSLEMVLGAPPRMELEGVGSIKAMNISVADLSKYSTAAKVDAYTPTLSARYHFGSIDSKFRPYVGAGFMYAIFNNVKVDSGLKDEVANNSKLNALRLNPRLGKVTVEDAVAPVAMIGMDYNINKDWYATASVSYAHLTTKAKLDVKDAKAGTLISGQSDIEIKPIVTYLGLGYRF